MEQKIDKNDETEVQVLYKQLLESWNVGSAGAFAALFTENGTAIGFDGSQMNGRAEIASQLDQIFKQHQVATYVAVVKEVRAIGPTVFLVRAEAGMVPPGKQEIDPAVNVIQTLVATKNDNGFQIVIFQNTPAAFHGRPELAQELTAKLQEVVQYQVKNVQPV